jgi:ATP-binding cassette subfamily C (CFTR/MRP) protein 1
MLIFSEHICTVRPSFIISTYLFFSTILDLARTRTVWLIGGIDTISIIMTTELALKCVMLLLESFNKRATLAPPYRSYPPEATSGVFSRSMFWWLNEMMLKGFRHVFCLEELFPLDNQLYSKNVLKRLHHNWTACTCKFGNFC